MAEGAQLQGELPVAMKMLHEDHHGTMARNQVMKGTGLSRVTEAQSHKPLGAQETQKEVRTPKWGRRKLLSFLVEWR